MSKDDKREMRIEAGRAMIVQAQKAVDSGQYAGFYIFSCEDDPAVITEIIMIKRHSCSSMVGIVS
jgi:hypothetical protein